MAEATSSATAVYELPDEASAPAAEESVRCEAEVGDLPQALLVENARWFCQLRWVVVAVLSLFGMLSLPGFVRLGLRLDRPTGWAFAAAGGLAIANLAYLGHIRWLKRAEKPMDGVLSLWAQIVVDLLVLTFVVHHVGMRETCIGLAYLLHIVLSCIFFSRFHSLIVTLLACSMFTACALGEVTGVIATVGIFAPTTQPPVREGAGLFALNLVAMQVIWLVVWHLASHLSDLVRSRDQELANTNRRLMESQRERAVHMLRVTHELKAPFAAIHANAQILLLGHAGPLSDAALDVASRISVRARRLAAAIQDMLQLANLNSPATKQPTAENVDLRESLRWCLGQVEPLASERAIRLVFDGDNSALVTPCTEDHLKMLFSNLLTNAVAYSHSGGKVEVHCGRAEDGYSRVTIADHGIGIHPDKLPRIFEEFYRTDEAVKHWKESTGLGLTIVRAVARTHGIRVRVESCLGQGTQFILTFAPPCHTVQSVPGD